MVHFSESHGMIFSWNILKINCLNIVISLTLSCVCVCVGICVSVMLLLSLVQVKDFFTFDS